MTGSSVVLRLFGLCVLNTKPVWYIADSNRLIVESEYDVC